MRVMGRKRFRVKVQWKGDFGKLMAECDSSLKEYATSLSGVRPPEVLKLSERCHRLGVRDRRVSGSQSQGWSSG